MKSTYYSVDTTGVKPNTSGSMNGQSGLKSKSAAFFCNLPKMILRIA